MKNLGQKIILITKQTCLQEMLAQHNTKAQTAFYLESRGDKVEHYESEDTQYQQALEKVFEELQTMGRVQILERALLVNFIFAEDDIVVVLGQDGLVANVLKYLNRQPVIAINPDPQRYDGILLPFQLTDIHIVADVIKGRYQKKEITMARAKLNDGQELLAVNDFYIGPRYPISARYQLNINGLSENQSSSGLIISTGLGSSGWLKSVVIGAAGILGQVNQQTPQFSWDSRYLYYAVREPFPSQTTGTSLVYGKIEEVSHFSLTSQMANYGIIFSDGMIDDSIGFNTGISVEIGLAEQQGCLVV